MTKKDYIAIATIIRESGLPKGSLARTKITNRLADYMERENHHFNREVFLAACIREGN